VEWKKYLEQTRRHREIVLAETKNHLNWELLSEAAKALSKPEGKRLQAAVDDTSTTRPGGCGSSGSRPLGVPALLPPPEEEKDVSTSIGAARAKQQRAEEL